MKTNYSVILLVALIALCTTIIPAYAYHDDRTSRGSEEPRVVAKGSTAYVVWKESTDPQFWDVYFEKITNDTLHEPINLTKGMSFYPDVQLHVSKNNVYVLWEDRQSPEGDDAVFFTKSNDSGQTFDNPTMIAPANDDHTIYRPFTMQTSNETLYVFASNWNREIKQNQVVYLTSTDFGETFSEPIVLFNHEQSDQEIQVAKYDDTIYILSDDRHDFDEKGSIYLRKILPDGTLTDMVNVNGGTSAVTHPQFAVFGENVYVAWRDRVSEKGNYGITERWYPAFTKSHDGGVTFDEPIILDSDPRAIDTVGVEGNYVFANNDSVYVLFKSEYWDGQTQEFKTYLAHSTNKGEDFAVKPVSLNDSILQHGYIISKLSDEHFYQMAITVKNLPYNDAAVYFSDMSNNESSNPVDILKNISTEIGWMPDLAIDEDHIHFVSGGNYNKNCILYSSSDDGGMSFRDVINISPNGNDIQCLGAAPNIPPPAKQMSMGVDSQDVKCQKEISKGYILVLKASDKMPACVTVDSYDALKKRKWILDDYDKTLALQAATKFVSSSPTFSFDGIKDSLKLDVLHVRKSIPAVVTITGEFQTLYPGYGNRLGQEFPHEEKPITHKIKMVIAQNNMVHSAIVDDAWNVFTQDTSKPQPEIHSSVASGPTVSTVMTVGSPVNSMGLIPVIITERSENVSGSATFWQFQIMGYNADNRYKEWDALPKDNRVGWVFASEDGDTDVWDNSVIPGDMFGIPEDLHGYPMFCDGKRIEGESGHPSGIPIKPEFDTIIIQSGDKGILPDSDGIYAIEFATLFDTVVELPENAEIIENKTMLCTMEDTREDATHAYYTKLKFKIGI